MMFNWRSWVEVACHPNMATGIPAIWHHHWPRRHLLSFVLQLAQDLRLVPREQVLGARLAAAVLHPHGLVVGEAVDVARPAVAKLACCAKRREFRGEMVVGYGSDLLFMRSYVFLMYWLILL